MTFEESIKQLNEIVNQMESGNLSIDESLAKFCKGSKPCEERMKQLNKAKEKVNNLQKQMDEIVEKSFNAENE